jgi:glycosyltransferase involved in cell wall biosynthesis
MISSSLGIVALVPDDWGDTVTVRHQVLSRLAKYYKIVWIGRARNWRTFLSPSSARFLAADRWSEPTPSMEVLTSGWLHPNFHRPAWLSRASLRSRLSLARERLLGRGATRIALYLWRDEFAGALDLVDHDFSCYDIDDEYSFSDTDRPNSPQEMNLLRRVDQVIIHSSALFDKKGGVNPNTALIPNGVDFQLFSTPHQEPPDIARIAHPRVGYAGVIKRQLDLDLLLRLARVRPQWSFVLVGPVGNVEGKEQQIATLRQMSNVHFVGGKPVHDLPAYVQHFDVCMMCYDVNDYTKYIFPLKLNEYLASGRPTVSSPIAAVRRFAHVVKIAGNDSEWLAAIELALGEAVSDRSAAQARQAVAQASDWGMLVERIARLFAAAEIPTIARQSADRSQPRGSSSQAR